MPCARTMVRTNETKVNRHWDTVQMGLVWLVFWILSVEVNDEKAVVSVKHRHIIWYV